jgi:predicted extracellular nuclease
MTRKFFSAAAGTPCSAAALHRLVRIAIAAVLIGAGLFVVSPRPRAATTELFFSEYIEGSSNNKALEIYNGTGAAIDLGASGYSVQMFFNGNPAAGLTINLVGTVASGDVFVLAQSAASAAILAQADQTNGSGWFNGDDAVVLRKGTTVVDVIGQIGLDPGTEWGTGLTSTADNTLRRKTSVSAGDPTGGDAFDPSLEWDGFATDTFTGLGCAGVSACLSGTGAASPSSVLPGAATLLTVTVTPGPGSSGITVTGDLSAIEGSSTTEFVDDETQGDVTAGDNIFSFQTTVPPSTPEGLKTLSVSIADAQGHTASASISVTILPPPTGCGVPATQKISAVQGSGPSTPFAGQNVRVEGIVTGDFQASGQLGGFYFQDPSPDADPATSEGLFAFTGTGTFDVNVGDRVLVSGKAIEFNGLTELSPVTSVDVCGSGSIAPLVYNLPRAEGTTFEPLEDMLVTFPQTLTATEHFQLGRFGEVTVSADGRLFQPTDRVAAGAAAAAEQSLNDRRRLLIDDGSTVQNPASVPFLSPDVLRLGDTATGITGVLTYGFGVYRLEPTAPIVFARTNPRPLSPAAVGGEVRVASFNTLNYFTTLRSSNPDARGADTATELARQQAKEVAAITGLDADVIGLMEVENDGSTTIGTLAAALNAATAPGTYAFIDDLALNAPNEFGGTFGTDAIKVALIYRPAAVTPVGAARSSDDPVFSRPPLIQTFERAGGSERLTVAVNHFKSKGCDGAAGSDLDQGDGQGCFNARRVAQATALTELLDTLTDPIDAARPLTNRLIIGDLNAYTEEDPIHTLANAGYTELAKNAMLESDRYSYTFDGQAGELDHVLAGSDLLDNVTGVTIWHINADEPLILDYNTEFNPPSLYAADAYRTSDHDPVLIGLHLDAAPVLDAGGPYSVVEGSTVLLTANGTDADGDTLSYAWDLDGDGSFETAGQSVTFSAAALQAPATITVRVQVSDGTLTVADEATVNVVWAFGGFLQPIDGSPTVNTVKAGSTVPVRFTLGGDQGLAIFAPGYPTSVAYACDAAAPVDAIEEIGAAGQSTLTYDPATGVYTLPWKTQKSWANTCRRLIVKFADGTFQYASFMFVK